MDHILAVDGSELAPESVRMIEYLKIRAAEMTAVEIRERIRSAAQELENAVGRVTAAEARQRPIPGKWDIAEVVDHISQTQIRGSEELRHLLAGRRPPLPPVYEAIRSGAGTWAPWELLREELHTANQAMIDVLESASEPPPSDHATQAPTVKTVMVTLCARADGTTGPQIYFAELHWREYALLQRLHLLDHRTQVKKLHARLTEGSPRSKINRAIASLDPTHDSESIRLSTATRWRSRFARGVLREQRDFARIGRAHLYLRAGGQRDGRRVIVRPREVRVEFVNPQ